MPVAEAEKSRRGGTVATGQQWREPSARGAEGAAHLFRRHLEVNNRREVAQTGVNVRHPQRIRRQGIAQHEQYLRIQPERPGLLIPDAE